MTAAAATAHAQQAKALAATANLRPGSVVWFDNEDPAAVELNAQELAYYDRFFTELTSAAPGQPLYRPGLYAHQAIAAQLLALHPDLYVWEVDYWRKDGQSDAPPERTRTPADRRFGPEPANPNMLLKSFHVVPPGRTGWISWPVWRQWEGNNQARIPPKAIGRLVPFKNWDFDSALVGDPADPVASPRLLALGEKELARLDDLDPTWDASDAQTALRRGRLRVVPLDGTGAGVEIPQPSATDPFHPYAPLRATSAAEGRELFAVTADGQLASARHDHRTWSPSRMLWRTVRTLRLPFAYDACAVLGTSYVFFAGARAKQMASRRQPGDPWSDPQAAGRGLVLHPFGKVAVARRGRGFDVLTVGGSGKLVWLTWRGDDSWPPSDFVQVPRGDVLSSGALTAVSRSPGELICVAVGPDLRLRRFLLIAPGAGPPTWNVLALGGATDLVSPHTSLSIRNSAIDGTLVVLAIGTDGFVYRYTLTTAAASGVLGAASRSRVGGPAADLPQPNPFGDVTGVVDGAGGGAVAAAGVTPGAAVALVASPAGAAWRQLPA